MLFQKIGLHCIQMDSLIPQDFKKNEKKMLYLLLFRPELVCPHQGQLAKHLLLAYPITTSAALLHLPRVLSSSLVFQPLALHRLSHLAWGCVFHISFLLFFFFYLGLHLKHMEVCRLWVKSELQLPAYTTATAMWDPSQVCNLHHSSWQRQTLNPRARPGMEPATSWFLVGSVKTNAPRRERQDAFYSYLPSSWLIQNLLSEQPFLSARLQTAPRTALKGEGRTKGWVCSLNSFSSSFVVQPSLFIFHSSAFTVGLSPKSQCLCSECFGTLLLSTNGRLKRLICQKSE